MSLGKTRRESEKGQRLSWASSREAVLFCFVQTSPITSLDRLCQVFSGLPAHCLSELSEDRDCLNLFSLSLIIFIPVNGGIIELSALGKRLTRV